MLSEVSEKILVSLWPGLGDIMYATPVIRALREKHQNAHITVMSLWGKKGKRLLQHNPYVDQLIFTTPSSILKILRQIRKKYTLGVQLSFPIQWFFILAGIKKRVSFAKNSLWWLMPYFNRNDADLHASEYFLQAADKIDGIKYRDGKGYDLFLSRESLDWAHQFLKNNRLLKDTVVVIHPGGRCNKSKRWSKENFSILCDKLHDRFEAKIVLIGGKEDVEASYYVRENTRATVFVLSNEIPLLCSAAIISKSSLFIGNDSGPTQMAAATETPVVAIYASSNERNFRPLTPKSVVVSPKMKCVPCLHFSGYMWLFWGLRLRYINWCRAMEEITPAQVFQACEKLLNEKSKIA